MVFESLISLERVAEKQRWAFLMGLIAGLLGVGLSYVFFSEYSSITRQKQEISIFNRFRNIFRRH